MIIVFIGDGHSSNISQNVILNASLSSDVCFNQMTNLNTVKRYLVYSDNSTHPVRIPYADWTSARVSAQVANILLSEVVGYETLLVDIYGNDIYGVTYVTGCTDPFDQTCTQWDNLSPLAHFTVESWIDGINTAQRLPANIRPSLLSVTDYNIDDGYFLLQDVREAGLKSKQPVLLDHFESYDARFYQPHQFFDPWQRMFELIPHSAFASCTDIFSGAYAYGVSGTNASYSIRRYVALTNDTDLSCYNDRVWFSPACRHDPSLCVPLILKWYLDWAMQRATLHNMPLAIVVVDPTVTENDASYYTAVVRGRFLFHSYEPNDFQFDSEGRPPVLLNLPRRDPAAQATGDYRSGIEGLKARNYGWRLLRATDPIVEFVAASIAFADSDVDAFMTRSRDLQAGGASGDAAARAIACDWLHENRPRWAAWIPAICAPGQYPDPTLSQCLSCPAGSVCPGSADPASLCPDGFYCGPNSSRPVECPSDLGTSRMGASSAADCNQCRSSSAILVHGQCIQVPVHPSLPSFLTACILVARGRHTYEEYY